MKKKNKLCFATKGQKLPQGAAKDSGSCIKSLFEPVTTFGEQSWRLNIPHSFSSALSPTALGGTFTRTGNVHGHSDTAPSWTGF